MFDFILGFFIQSKESSDANSELFKEDDDEALYENPCEIRLCDLISVSLVPLIDPVLLLRQHGISKALDLISVCAVKPADAI